MKNVYLSFLLLFTTIVSFSQDATYTYSPEEGADIIIRDLNVTSDGSIIHGYDYMQVDAPPRAGIMKTDLNGDIIWSKELSIEASAEDCSFELIENSEGNFYHWGLSKELETDHMRALLSEISPDGEILWSKEYNFGINPLEWYTVNKIQILPSGDLSMMIAISNKVIAIKTDHEGNIIWGTYTAVGPPDEGGKNPGFELLTMPDGGCMISSKIDDYFSLVRIGGSGDFMWSKSYNIAATTETPYTHGKTIFQTPSGKILVAGFLRAEAPASDLIPFIMEVSEEAGEIMWMKTIDDRVLGFVGSADFKLDGEDVILDMLMADWHHYIMKIDDEGTILSAVRSVNRVPSGDYNKLHIASGGNYYMYGSIPTVGGVSGYKGGFHKTDEPFEESCMFETVIMTTSEYSDYVLYPFDPYVSTFTDEADIEITTTDRTLYKAVFCEEEDEDDASVKQFEEDLSLKIYPNPAHSQITIIVSDQLVNTAYSIMDVSGKVVMTNTVLASQMDLDLSGLTSGQYVLSITGENSSYAKKITLIK